MTEKQYNERRAAIMRRVYIHEDTFADGRPKFPNCLKADLRDLKKLDEQYIREGGDHAEG